MTVSFSSICLHLTKIRTTGDVTVFSFYSAGIGPKALCVLDEHSMKRATASAPVAPLYSTQQALMVCLHEGGLWLFPGVLGSFL